MDVTCERCGTEYEFDETLLSARGTSVKCTNCGHVFKVYPRGHGDAESTSTWRLQRRDGTIDTIESLRELQRRIASGELTPHDEIARGNEGMKPLGSIPELETFFQAAAGDAPTAPSPSPYPPAIENERPDGAAGDGGASRARTPSSNPPKRRPRQPTLLGVVPVPRAPAPPGSSEPEPGGQAQQPETPVVIQPSVGEHRVDELPVAEPAVSGSPVVQQPAIAVQPSADFGTEDETPPRTFTERTERLPEQSEPPGVVVVPADDSLRLPEAPERATPVPSPIAQTDSGAIQDADFEEPQRPARGRSTPPPAYFEDDDDIPELPGRGWSPMRWLLVVTAAVVIGVIAANFEQVLTLVGLGSGSGEATGDALADGDAAMQGEHLAAYESAIEAYQKALEEDEAEDETIYVKLSRAHALAAQALADGATQTPAGETLKAHAAAALNYAEQALMMDPQSLPARLTEADGLRLTGETKRARASLERARSMPFSRTAEFYRIDARVSEAEHDDLAKGLLSARQATEIAPDSVRVRLLLARAELASDDYEGARAEVDRVLATDAKHPAALALAGSIARATPSEDAAKVEESGGDSSDQPDGDAEAAADGTGEPQEAEEPPPETEATPEVDVAPPSPEKATTKPAAVDAEGAEPAKPTPKAEPRPATRPKRPKRPEYDEYDRLAEAAGSDAFVDGRPPIRDFGWYMREGEASLAGRDYTKARAFFESALEARPGSGDATDALGRVAFASGDYALSVRYFRSAAQRGHPDGYFSLGEAYERLGKRDEAVSAYYTYLKRRPSGTHVSEARAAIKRIEPRVQLPEPEQPNPSTPEEPEATQP
ncbi:MAG: tetratricopeptide repeat protein [Myxococcota bacterium]